MALCLAASLLECGGFDAADQMDRYLRWLQKGYYSSTGGFVDVGATVANALRAYQKTGESFSGSTAPDTAGNGSIMRLAPVPLYYYPDRAAIWEHSGLSSRTTHGTAECIEACCLLGDIIYRALTGCSKDETLLGTPYGELNCTKVRDIASGAYLAKEESEIKGSGYVVESLEAALWCFARENSIGPSLLRAANLGDDADTTAAVCGQVAGAYHGVKDIPPAWLRQLALRDEILELARRLLRHRASS
jgi:ADP-ribosyl-[dinitrogen reductase] hydrolase